LRLARVAVPSSEQFEGPTARAARDRIFVVDRVAGAALEGRPFVAAPVLRLGRANAARPERACGARFSSAAPANVTPTSLRFDQLKETASG
jgi:hypothetical protein